LLKQEEFTEYLKGRGIGPQERDAALEAVMEAYDHFDALGVKLVEASVADFESYVSRLIEEGRNSDEALIGLARYVYFMDMKEPWIYFAAILGGRRILPSISERLAEIAGPEARDRIFSGVEMPPLGSPPSAYCKATSQLMEHLEELDPAVYRKVLAGNHHGVLEAGFEKHKGWLEELGSIDAWLERMHGEAVAELEHYCSEGKVWYEQVITPEVVEYVRGNQEVLSGVREGEWIYNTKFPYSPGEYLKEKDPPMRRYYMCHCPLAREAILAGEPAIPMDWCYCSAGYGKVRYDVAFGVETEVEVLESVLGGSDKCRFRIRIPDEALAKYVED